MIKIIKNPEIYEYECSYCHCIFEFEAEDITYEPLGVYKELAFAIECPYCHTKWNLLYQIRDEDKKAVLKRYNITKEVDKL